MAGAPAAGDAMKVISDTLKDLAAGNITDQGMIRKFCCRGFLVLSQFWVWSVVVTLFFFF